MSRKIFSFWFILLPYTLLLYISLWLSVFLRYHGNIDQNAWNAHLKAFSVLYIFWMVVFFIHNLFEIQTLRRYTSLLFNLISAMVVNLLVAISYFYFQPNLILTPRRFLLIHIGVTFVLILIWHLLVKYFVKNKLFEGVYLFSFDNELEELEQEIKSNSFLGFRVLGHLNEQTLTPQVFSKNTGVILPENLHTNPQVISKFYQLRTLGVKFYNHKDFYENLLRKIYLSQINEIWFLENINYKEKQFYNLAKRVIDIASGLILFFAFVVSYPFAALIIKLSSRGPVLFVQERIGKNGKVFKIFKYRTMAGGSTSTWTSENDARITKFGKFLRKTKIDEWPQSINLLIGDISLVGPRPEQVGIVERLRSDIPFYDERHLVKPGISGWAQLNIYAGSLEETRLKLQYDLYYIKHRSLLFDLEIILKTIYYIFTWQGR